MKTRLRRWLVLFWLAHSCASTATANEAETVGQAPAAAEKTTRGPEQSGVRRVLTSILELFGGRSEEKSGPGPEHAREPASVDVGTQSAAPDPELDGGAVDVTHSHVYRTALDIIAEIDILRDAHANVRDAQAVIRERPAAPALRPDQRPIHALVKSLEVMHKIAHVQRRLGMIPVEPGRLPTEPVGPEEVLGSVDAVIEELRRVKRQLVVSPEIEPAPFAGGKTPSLVTRRLGHASLLLDDLVGRDPTPGELYEYMSRTHEQVEVMGASLGAALEREAPAVEGPRTPVDCGQQVLRAIYKAVGLQSRLGMDASTVPDLMLHEITASGVLDAAGILLAEVVHIRAYLSVDMPVAERRQSPRKQWHDVFALALLVVANLDRLTRAADEPGPGSDDQPGDRLQ